MNRSKTSFLVPGIGYLALAVVTLGFCLSRIIPTVMALSSSPEDLSFIELMPLIIFSVVILVITSFYIAMGISILKRKGR
ncbi:MAG: hypothetical protein ABIP97_06030, partial [Chthoniobacterales bacterium]